MSMKMTIFPFSWCCIAIDAHCDVTVTLTPLPMLPNIVDTLRKCCPKTGKSDWRFLSYSHFCILPLFYWSDHYLTIQDVRHGTEPTPQHLITQSARPQLMPLLVPWQLEQHPSACPSTTGTQKMHTTLSPYFGIPWRTGSSSTASHLTVRTTSDMSAVLETKSLEMHAQWMPTGNEEEQRATKVKASTFLNRIQQGITHNVNTHAHLGELKDDMARLGEDPQDLVTCIKKLMDHCEMINDEHQEHKLHCPCHPCILSWGKAPWQTYGKTIQDTFWWASWHHCEPLCYQTCSRTSLPQHQTCGHDMPWQVPRSQH